MEAEEVGMPMVCNAGAVALINFDWCGPFGSASSPSFGWRLVFALCVFSSVLRLFLLLPSALLCSISVPLSVHVVSSLRGANTVSAMSC